MSDLRVGSEGALHLNIGARLLVIEKMLGIGDFAQLSNASDSLRITLGDFVIFKFPIRFMKHIWHSCSVGVAALVQKLR